MFVQRKSSLLIISFSFTQNKTKCVKASDLPKTKQNALTLQIYQNKTKCVKATDLPKTKLNALKLQIYPKQN